MTQFRADGTRRLRLWSAGCSSGEEPYSIAMTLRRSMPDLGKWNAKILASDIDTDMVERGRNGIYEERTVDSIPAAERKKFVDPLGGEEGRYRMAQPLRSLIAFKQLNLLHRWPMKGPFDVIFCRNVVIYFDKETQRELFNRYADILRDGSFLYIGHSESLYKVSERFRLVGQSIYEKIE
jgi:chemotaxis protein methyltransferase CheR